MLTGGNGMQKEKSQEWFGILGWTACYRMCGHRACMTRFLQLHLGLFPNFSYHRKAQHSTSSSTSCRGSALQKETRITEVTAVNAFWSLLVKSTNA